jgi:malonyl CoA-acyl carrier protein transacylase
MAAVIGMEPGAIAELLAGSDEGRRLDVANFNSFEQTVIAGPKDDSRRGEASIRSGRRARVHPAQCERALPLALHARADERVRDLSGRLPVRAAGDFPWSPM